MLLPTERQLQTAGVKLQIINGWEVPSDFGDPVGEQRAAREAAVLADRSDRGKIRVSGPDRVAFLHALLSNNIEKLRPGEGTYALFLNVKGQILAEFNVFQLGDSFLLTIEPGERSFAFGALRRFKLRSKVVLTDETEALGVLSLDGPLASEIIERWVGEPIVLAEYGSVERSVGDSIVTIAGSRQFGETGYDIYAPWSQAGAIWEAVMTAGGPVGIRPIGRRVWEALRIEAGSPKYGPELNERTLPPEARLESRALDYEKGCYPGQEIMARIRFRGQVNRLLVRLSVDGSEPPRPQTALLSDDHEVGTITSAAFSPLAGRTVALGYVRREQAEYGTALRLPDGRTVTVEENSSETTRKAKA